MTEENKTALDTAVAEDNTTVEARVETVKEPIDSKYVGKSIEDVIKMHQEAEKLIGKKAPSAPEEYILPDVFDFGKKDALIAKAKELNVTQDQMKTIADILIEDSRDHEALAKATQLAKAEANKAALDEMFKGAAEERQREFEELSNKYAGPEMADKLKELDAFSNPVFMEFFNKINDRVLKHTMAGTDYVNRKMTDSEKKDKILAIYSDPEKAKILNDPSTPAHKALKAELARLRSQ